MCVPSDGFAKTGMGKKCPGKLCVLGQKVCMSFELLHFNATFLLIFRSFVFLLPLFFLVTKGVKQCGGKVKLYAQQDDATSSCKVLSVIMAIVVVVVLFVVAEQF